MACPGEAPKVELNGFRYLRLGVENLHHVYFEEKGVVDRAINPGHLNSME